MLRALLWMLLPSLFAAHAAAQLQWTNPAQEAHRTPEDNEVVVHYAFKNQGTAAIDITNIATSCGCTTAEPLAKKSFAPGETGEIGLKFTFGGRTGEQRKYLTVSTSDGQRASLELHCWIDQSLSLSPALVFWRIGDAPEAKRVQLLIPKNNPLKILSVKTSNPQLTATLLPAGDEGTPVIEVKPAATNRQEIAQIAVATDYPPDAPKTYILHARIK